MITASDYVLCYSNCWNCGTRYERNFLRNQTGGLHWPWWNCDLCDVSWSGVPTRIEDDAA